MVTDTLEKRSGAIDSNMVTINDKVYQEGQDLTEADSSLIPAVVDKYLNENNAGTKIEVMDASKRPMICLYLTGMDRDRNTIHYWYCYR